jgi:hypothetical protein
VRHKAMSDDIGLARVPALPGLAIHKDNRNHALTGVAIKCRPFGPDLATDRKVFLGACVNTPRRTVRLSQSAKCSEGANGIETFPVRYL